MTYTQPKLTVTFTGNDLPTGHLTTQEITYEHIIKGSIRRNMQLLDGLKSSSNQVQLQLSRSCQSTEDIIATSGDIEAVLTDGITRIFTGYISTDFAWKVTKHGEQVLQITLEDVGTRLFAKPFIETGKHFFSGTASVAVNAICAAVGVTVNPSHTSALTQTVAFTAEAGATCKDLITQLCYECNAVYHFDENGQLCIFKVAPSTSGAAKYDGSKLVDNGGSVITLSKKLRTYKGARVAYDEISTADDYLVYRNTTGQDADHPYCNLELQPGEHFDGTEIYTAQEWAEAVADTFREPALIGAVNAASESQIVGSNEIINISDLSATTEKTGSLTATFTNVGGGYFKLDATNPGSSAGAFTRMDLYASIVYVKSHGVVRTAIDGVSSGKVLLEEAMSWIHDKTNAEKHANLLAQYNQFAGATYTFHSAETIPLGSVIQLNDNVYSGLDVYVMVYRSEGNSVNGIITYKAVAISTFDLTERAYYGISGQGPQGGVQGPPGPKGDSMTVEYALGTYTEPIYPPSENMTWEGDPMLWGGENMMWGLSPWSSTQPSPTRGMCIWMRTKVGSGPWIYSRLTGLKAWEPMCIGVETAATPTETQTGLPLVYGDYFVAGEEFEEDGVTYREGFVYTYDGNGNWYTMDLSDPENSEKALYACNELINSGINVTDSTASVYGWFRNLVAQNGVFSNLAANEAFIERLTAQEAFIENLVARIATLEDLIVTGNISNESLTTVNGTSSQTLSFTTSTQNIYNPDGSVLGTRPSVLKSTIDALFGYKSGILVAYSGSITINGTSYTASASSPFKLRYVYNGNGSSLVISNGSVYKTLADKTATYVAEEGYLAASLQTDTITSNSLQITATLGTVLVHDVIPSDSTVDKVGSSDNPFNSGTFSTLNVIGTKGLNYSWDLAAARSFTITDSSTHSESFVYDGYSFAAIEAYIGSGPVVYSGIVPLSSKTRLNAYFMIYMPTSDSAAPTIPLYVSANPVSQKIAYRCSSASANNECYFQIIFYK